MNIFVLDKDPVIAAQMHCNKHVVKMILETAQILSTAVWYGPFIKDPGMEKEPYISLMAKFVREKEPFIYKPTHRKHPCVLWAGDNSTRFNWLKQLGMALCEEYTYRYGKTHKSESIIKQVFYPAHDACFVDPPLEPFALAMPDIYKTKDAVESYRNYYLGAKQRMLIYTRRRPPIWIPDGVARWKEDNETRGTKT